MKQDKNCIFCKMAQKKAPAEFLDETDNFIAVLDKFPKCKGHALVIPKKHYVTVLDIPSTLGQEMLQLIKKTASKILEEKQGDGFNLVMNNLPPAGQAVMHAHIHLIPRREGDGLNTV